MGIWSALQSVFGRSSSASLFAAVKRENLGKARAILDGHPSLHGVIKRNGKTPLHFVYDSAEMARLLLSRGANPNAMDRRGTTPLHEAVVRLGRLDVATVLLEHGADPNAADKSGRTPLHHAVSLPEHRRKLLKDMSATLVLDGHKKSDQIDLVRLLLDHGAKSDAQDNLGFTALFCVLKGSVEIVRVLVERGADLQIRDNNGSSCLHHAALIGDVDLARLLLGEGACVNDRNQSGMTPLHVACRMDSVKTAAFLLAQGADVHAQTCDGRSPLHFVESVPLARLLVEHGAVITKDSRGQTAIGAARVRRLWGLMAWLSNNVPVGD